MPKARPEKTTGTTTFRDLPVHPVGELYSVFDEGSDAQIENDQFSRQRSKIWKNIV